MTRSLENAAPVRPGDLFGGKYRVERVLGAGGMGVVVAAKHVHLGQLVAVKFLLPAAMGDVEVVARFQREARAAVSLRSEHVARVFDVGALDASAGSVPYIVMEYLEGSTLRPIIKRGPLRIEDAVSYVIQACEAIEEAHTLGIVHRDIKPENLFLCRRLNGTPLVKVLDFGISKMAPSENEMQLTGTATLMGTPYYMSPEQMRSMKSATPRSDVWAMGAVLYELLAGKPPFGGQTVTEICSGVLTADPRPLPEVRADLAGIVLRCLQKDPAYRFGSMADLALALAPFVEAGPFVTRALTAPMQEGAPHSQGVSSQGPVSSQPTPPHGVFSPMDGVPVASAGAVKTTSIVWNATTKILPHRNRGVLIAFGISLVSLLGAIMFMVTMSAYKKTDVVPDVGPATPGETAASAIPSATNQAEFPNPDTSATAVPAESTSAESSRAPSKPITRTPAQASSLPQFRMPVKTAAPPQKPPADDSERVRK